MRHRNLRWIRLPEADLERLHVVNPGQLHEDAEPLQQMRVQLISKNVASEIALNITEAVKANSIEGHMYGVLLYDLAT